MVPKIFESSKIKYLGVILDSRLTWRHHINELSKKLNRAVGLLYKIRQFCTKEVLRSLYFSLFGSHLGYCIAVGGKSDNIYLEKWTHIQKRIARAITFSDFYAPSKPLLKTLCILSVPDLYNYQIASLMWDYDHGQLPLSLSGFFKKRADVHSLTLRNVNGNLYTSFRRNTKHGTNCFSHEGSLALNYMKNLTF